MKAARLPVLLLGLVILAAIVGPMLLPWRHDAIDWNAVRVPPGSPGHPLGTDMVGRDLLARSLAGTRITLLVAAAAAGVSLLIGVAWGAVAGWKGGRTDEAMMRIVDGLYALPFMFVVILLMVLFGRSILLVFLGIGAVEWLTMARVVRGQVLALRERPFVLAAEAAGARAPAIMIGHILPNLAGIAIAYLLLTIPQVVMIESFLSFLGLGVQEPLTSLGILVKEGADDMDVAPHALLLPGGILVTILICLTLIGEDLRDRLA
ncbi:MULTISPECIES: ABC transporter permease [Sphingomonadales]|uniref:Oligopeptide transport system permease protein OppC n=1 Tax=Edaphosphingomonas haloaromaticamans TaxID=653954 RepID=A0A1S1HJN7_9SPHN|nr:MULTISPECIES: ABC transporter permease subunit [Sphingomonas]AGH49683.1 binding-protein-dependent transport systems inner membrane component [Sphingomonas sp. MM-1]OHT22258.1 Oligopeptide transport system permease protein OppC [Sphingomonas haloaromaticamans]